MNNGKNVKQNNLKQKYSAHIICKPNNHEYDNKSIT